MEFPSSPDNDIRIGRPGADDWSSSTWRWLWPTAGWPALTLAAQPHGDTRLAVVITSWSA